MSPKPSIAGHLSPESGSPMDNMFLLIKFETLLTNHMSPQQLIPGHFREESPESQEASTSLANRIGH